MHACVLDVAPDQYVAERDRLVKQARSAKDRASATFYQSLKRPTVPLWAVLAAGHDADAVELDHQGHDRAGRHPGWIHKGC